MAVAPRVKIRGGGRESLAGSKHEKNPREETRAAGGGSWGVQIHGERKHRATFRHTIHVYVSARLCVRARARACVWPSTGYGAAFTNTFTDTAAHAFLTRNGPAHTAARLTTPTHRLHTYVGAVHIKLGGARSPSLPHKNKKHGSIHKQEGWGCSNLKRTPEFLPTGS